MLLMFIICNTLLVKIQDSAICTGIMKSPKIIIRSNSEIIVCRTPRMCFVGHAVLVLNAYIPVWNVTRQEGGHLSRESLRSIMAWFIAETSLLCSGDIANSSRKCWLDSEKLSLLLHGTILSNWVFVLKHIVCEANDRQRTVTWRRDLTRVLSTSCFQHCLKPCKTSFWVTGSTATNKKSGHF